MDEKKVQHLIEEVQRRPAIWNKTLPEHNNKIFIGSEWTKIAANINVLKTNAQSKWKSLKKRFQTEHSRVQLHRSGDGLEDAYQSTWPYYVSMSFLANCAVPKPSTGSLDCLFDVKPVITTKPKEKSVQSTDSDSNPVSSVMDKKGKEIAEHLLAMAEKQKWQLMEGSMCNIPQVDNNAVLDKQNMAFLETLLPTLREVRKEDVLLCRADITRIVFNYAYKGVPWKSINDSSKTPKPNSPVRPRKRRLTNHYNDDDDDDVQIVKCYKLQDTLPVKVEKKYQPSAEERALERNNTDVRMQRPGYNQWMSDPRPPSSWDPRYYEKQVPPQYYEEDLYGPRFTRRQPLTKMTYPPNVHHGMNIGMGPGATSTATDGSSGKLPSGRHDDFQPNNENQSAAKRTPTSTGVSPQTANAEKTATQSTAKPTMTPNIKVTDEPINPADL